MEFSSESEAVKALESLNGSELDGRAVSIERCSEKQGIHINHVLMLAVKL